MGVQEGEDNQESRGSKNAYMRFSRSRKRHLMQAFQQVVLNEVWIFHRL